MTQQIRLLSLVVVLLFAPAAFAADAVPTEKDAVAASRAVKLSEKLRCLVCQNQSIADSNAELAQDLRRQIHEQIAAGKSDTEIVDYMVARYGDFVLYEPPVRRRRCCCGRPGVAAARFAVLSASFVHAAARQRSRCLRRGTRTPRGCPPTPTGIPNSDSLSSSSPPSWWRPRSRGCSCRC
jgi:cytochrome c-type biogenesis protein CcmH/NrfF